LQLLQSTWAVLRQEGIMTLEQLIRDELARLTASEKGLSNNE
jgi:hypothetical protein